MNFAVRLAVALSVFPLAYHDVFGIKPKETRMKKSAYIWTREHSPERLRLIENVRRTWKYLFDEPEESGHYFGLQFCPTRFLWRKCMRFETVENAIVGGHSVTAHLQIIPARVWYGRELYRKATAITRARYPDFDAHRFIDGDRAGERRIEFLNERHALSLSHLVSSLWEVSKKDNPVIRETCFFDECDSFGNLPKDEKELRPTNVRIRLIANVEEVEDFDFSAVEADLKAGRALNISSEPISFSYEDIKKYLVELSNPELVLLNWEDALAPLCEADEALWKAADDLDADGLDRAIKAGANVNSLKAGRGNLISEIVRCWTAYHLGLKEEKIPLDREVSQEQILGMIKRLLDSGMHPDLHNFDDGIPAIVTAALEQESAIVALLLDNGADASVNPYWDESFEWPSAWDYAATDGFTLDEADAREVYYEMIKRRSSPLFEQSEEDRDRLEAMSQLPPDKNQTD
jgi:hypothetical protein